MRCGHGLCAIIGGDCSLQIRRSRGCRPNVNAKDMAPERLDEIRRLLAQLEGAADRAAAVRLAAIVRREMLDDRNVLSIVSDEAPELAPQLRRLLLREP